MQPYCDLDFLVALVVNSTASPVAYAAIRLFSPPYVLNSLHVVQLENVLFRAQKHFPTETSVSQRLAQTERAQSGLHRWENHLAEGVFAIQEVPWNEAYDLAIAWQRDLGLATVHPRQLLHPAIAKAAGATHYLGFDGPARQIARKAGLKLLPA